MKTKQISYLNNKNVLALPELKKWHDFFFISLIPVLKKNNALFQVMLERTLSYPLFFSKRKEVIFFHNQFLLLNEIRNRTITDQYLLKKINLQDVSSKQFTKEPCEDMQRLYVETIHLISRLSGEQGFHHVKFHQCLKTLLTESDCEIIFGKHCFTIDRYCIEVGISKSTYDRSRTGEVR